MIANNTKNVYLSVINNVSIIHKKLLVNTVSHENYPQGFSGQLEP